jgi:SAM-dependent methyltransferase
MVLMAFVPVSWQEVRMHTDLPNINWDRLRGLRDLFLTGEPLTEDYWTSANLLRDYDITLGERIGWKWDAVIRELKLRGWSPPSTALDDLGCGTGVAARRMLSAFPGHFKKVTLWDRSERAMKYARQKIRHEHPEVKVVCAAEPPSPHGLVLISHVLTECGDETAADWMDRLEKARGLAWVEPGTYAASRLLIEVREALTETFKVRAPCTHQQACGLLAEGMEAHWCHHFAPAPEGVHQDSFWGVFRREMNLELSPVAYSFLVLDRVAPDETAWTRLIGEPLKFPKFVRVLGCRAEGVEELVASRRMPLYRDLKKGNGPGVYRFERKNKRITGGGRLG